MKKMLYLLFSFLLFNSNVFAMKKKNRFCLSVRKNVTRTYNNLYYWGVTQFYKRVHPLQRQEELMLQLSPLNEDEPKYVQALINAGVDPSCPMKLYENKVHPLIKAVEAGHVKTAQLICEHIKQQKKLCDPENCIVPLNKILNQWADPEDNLTVLGKALKQYDFYPSMFFWLQMKGAKELHSTKQNRVFLNELDTQRETTIRNQKGIRFDEKEQSVKISQKKYDEIRKRLGLEGNH